MPNDSLKDRNKKDLARMARDRGIAGWHAMRKDQLIRALATQRKPSANGGKKRPQPQSPKVAPRKSSSKISARARPAPASKPLNHGANLDRIIMMVRDPYWLHAYWELSRGTLGRAQAALGQDWHGARPILRVMDVTSEDTTTAAERHVRDIEIHGGVNNWYIDVTSPSRTFRVDIGYVSKRGRFYVLARSNVVAMPKAGIADAADQNQANLLAQFEKVARRAGHSRSIPCEADARETFEQSLKRPFNGLAFRDLGQSLHLLTKGFHFNLDAELIVYGSTEPNAKVTLQGEPVQLRPDGTFTVRFSLPDSRQIIPAVAESPDGVEERTIVLAVERNTKQLEPMIHDGSEI